MRALLLRLLRRYRSGSEASLPAAMYLAANDRYLMMDGTPWFPLMGEFHYSRYPENQWEKELLKIKAAGIQVISTYVFWIHHEEVEGEFNWTGQRDLRRFIELCSKHGLYVWLRIGPFDHGEVRNGGFPDWLLEKTATRENNPVFLHYVRRFDAEIAKQVKGLFWKDGGPIIGIQLENEYSALGPGKGAGIHPSAAPDGARGGTCSAVLYSDGMGQCGCPIARRASSL